MEGGASTLAVGPSDVLGQQLPLLGVPGINDGADDDEEPAEPEVEEIIDKSFVSCELVHSGVIAFGGQSVQPRIKASRSKEGIRGRKCGVITGNMSVEEMLDFVKAHGWKHYVVCAYAEGQSFAIVLQVGSKRIQLQDGMDQRLLDEKTEDAVQRVLTSSASFWTTVKLKPTPLQQPAEPAAQKDELTRDDFMGFVRAYMHLNPAEWHAEVWSFSQKHKLTLGESHILKKPKEAEKLRTALLNLEGAKAFVKHIADPSSNVLKLMQFCGLDDLLAIRLHPDGTRSCMPLMAAIMSLMDEVTFVLTGDAGLGKSALARGMAAHYCEANGTPYYIESNTPDSLRSCYVNGFFREKVPIYLDEWKPIGDKYTGPDGIDMLKCLTTVGDGATIKCRYSDIRFFEQQPRTMSCNVKNLKEWCDGLGCVSQEDKNAVLRRCIFVEVDRQIIPHELQKKYLDDRRESCYDKMAALAAQQGLDVPNKDAVNFKNMVQIDGEWMAP
jgi:hypothetical protein